MQLLGMTGNLWGVKRVLAVAALALAFPAAAFAWGGTYPTGDATGTQVHVEVSDSYPVDQTLPQGWAAYLGTLVHGPELAKLTLDLMPLSEVTNATTAAGSATLWSATMDWPPLGYIANVRTTGAQNMTDNIELPSAASRQSVSNAGRLSRPLAPLMPWSR